MTTYCPSWSDFTTLSSLRNSMSLLLIWKSVFTFGFAQIFNWADDEGEGDGDADAGSSGVVNSGATVTATGGAGGAASTGATVVGAAGDALAGAASGATGFTSAF